MDSKNMNNKRVKSLVAWSDLPEELLHLVCHHLRLGDYLSFRGVCSTWRAAAKQLNYCLKSPLLMLPYSQVYGFHYLKCPLEGKCYKLNLSLEFNLNYRCIGSFHGWLIMIGVERRDIIFFLNPFTSARIDLPQWDKTNIYKVVLSSVPTDPNCTVIIVNESFRGFSFCRVGDDEWRKEESDCATIIDDIIVFRGKFYLLCSLKYGTNATMHFNQLEYLEVPYHLYSNHLLSNIPHLVESGGEVLLVVKRYNGRVPYIPYSMMVFRLDPSTSSWIETKTIGNRVLFLGRSCSVSFTAVELRCRENQIYFVEPFYDNTTWWVFNMEDGSIVSSSSSFGNKECKLWGDPLWITPSFV